MPKNVVCKKCNNLVNDWCEKVIDSPDPDMQRDCPHFREKTNADRIRSMNDEELAVCLYEIGYDGIGYGRGWFTPKGALKWLQQPAEEEAGNETD